MDVESTWNFGDEINDDDNGDDFLCSEDVRWT